MHANVCVSRTEDCTSEDEKQVIVVDSCNCTVCEARATGYHFAAQSCSACAAFFRRSIVNQKLFRCKANNCCIIHYSQQLTCQACRLQKCLKIGMEKKLVQPKKAFTERQRAFYTKSGIKRNKKFSLTVESDPIRNHCQQNIPDVPLHSPQQTPEMEPVSFYAHSTTLSKDVWCNRIVDDKSARSLQTSDCAMSSGAAATAVAVDQVHLHAPNDVLQRLIAEEMKISERRRILFCERPVGSILGRSQSCPYTVEEIFPLLFREFHMSIRTHILLVYEWLRSWPAYDMFDKADQITFLRKCVLYHTILDPSYLTLQIGYPKRFVMQNGGYVAVDEDCQEGWQDEKEISSATKQKIYRPLLRQLMSDIVEPMAAMRMSLEEFVALKAFVSWKGAICEISESNKYEMRSMLDAVCLSLHRYYEQTNRAQLAERFGNIVLLLSAVFATGLQFVESHHEIAFFDLCRLDSLLVQLLKCEDD